MKKITVLLSTLCVVLGACRKDDLLSHSVVLQPTMVKATGYENVTTGGGKNVLLGIFNLTTGNHNNPAVAFDVDIATAISMAHLQNFYFKITKKGDTAHAVYTSTPIPPAGLMQFDYSDDLQPNTEYVVLPYVYALDAAVGQVSVQFQAVYSWYEERDWRYEGLPEVVGPTVTISPFKITWVPLPGVIQDNVEMPLYEFTLENLLSKPLSFPQFSIEINVSDVSADDNLGIKDQKWMVNNVDSTGRIRFVNNLGASVPVLSEGTSILYIPYVTGSRDQKIEGKQKFRFTYLCTPSGFVHDGNGISVRLRVDAAYVADKYVNNINTGDRVRLFSTQSSATSPIEANMIYAIVGPSYSAIPGTSTNKFSNSGRQPVPETQNFHQ